MTDKILFLSEGKMGLITGNKNLSFLTSQALETYRKNLLEIENKKKWKTTGTGAKFMGIMEDELHEHAFGNISGMTKSGANEIIYASNQAGNGGLHIKDISDDMGIESHIIRQNNLQIEQLSYQGENGQILASVSQGELEKHIGLFERDSTNFQILTEGDCIDQNPSWEKDNPHIIYYDSAGIARYENGEIGEFSARSICRLNMRSGEITYIAENPKFDFIKPKTDGQGYLYYIKKPYESQKSMRTDVKDFVLFIPRVMKALFGWLNFFTQRYSGESLKSRDSNPTKTKQKSQQELFVEGNLIRAEKNLAENKKRGEKYVGIFPANWELVKSKAGQEETVVKKGVCDFAIDDKGAIYYSNGKYMMKLQPDGTEEFVCETSVVNWICV